MFKKNKNPLSIWFFEGLLEYDGICHFISSRTGGFSSPPYDSLNLGFHVGDDPQKVLQNRELLSSILDISLDSFTFCQQVHAGGVRVITEDLKGSGAIEPGTAIKETDALVTNLPNICLIVLVADCVPILFFDPQKKVAGIAHAGWRGTVQLVAQNTVKIFQERFDSSPADIRVALGPAIGPCCYEVGPEVAAQIEGLFGDRKSYIRNVRGNDHFSLWDINRDHLLEMGIPEENIESCEICTHCNHGVFFSYRSEKHETGRFGAGIMIKGT